MGVPTIALVFGNSTAGGAYVPGMSDYVVMIDQRSKVFLGGPPLVKMATGEESDDESLGGAEMHATVSGLADHFAVDELDALRIGRRIVARLNRARPADGRLPSRPPRYDPEQLLGIVSADLRVPFDPRDVLARLVDDSDFDEFKPRYGTSLVTGFAELHGHPDRHPRQPPRHPLQRGVEQGDAVHPAGQPERHAPRVPAEHHGLHGRSGVRATRHDQGRRQDDQRRHQLDGAAPHGEHGGQLRRGQLRHVWPGLRARASCSPGPTPRRR